MGRGRKTRRKGSQGRRRLRSRDDWIPPMPSFQTRCLDRHRSSLPRTCFCPRTEIFCEKAARPFIPIFSNASCPKKRILELYLNVIEWGDGVYGAEAASRTYFKKSASDLTKEEAAFLSAMIPSPLNIFNPAKNRKRVVRRQRVILRGMNSIKLAY